MQRTCVGWPARSVRSLRYHGTVLCLADSAPNFTANRSFNDPTPQRYCHANPARSPVRWRVRTNVWRRPTSPWDGAKRLKSGEAIPAARRNCVRRQRQGPLRVSAAGYFMTVGTAAGGLTLASVRLIAKVNTSWSVTTLTLNNIAGTPSSIVAVRRADVFARDGDSGS